MSETDPWNIAREEFKKRRMRKKKKWLFWKELNLGYAETLVI